jgi:hypothetical protein
MRAKPGDIIIITNKRLIHLYREECVVIKPNWDPEGASEYILVRNSRDALIKLRRSSCQIVRKEDVDNSQLCPDCNGTGKIELFTSTVKCGCGG